MQDAKRTPLYDAHLALGGKMVEFCGWMLPVQYSGILQEHKAVRESCGLFDVSHMGELTARGPGALNFLNHIATNDFTSMQDGQCRYSPICYPDGGTVDDLIVYRFHEDEYLIIVNAANREKDYQWMRENLLPDMELADISDTMAQLALQGPAWRDVLARAGVTDPLPEKPYTFLPKVSVAGVPCLVSRTGYTGEPGIELYLKPSDAPIVMAALLAGGAVPCGLGARDLLRFECAMPLYGHELSDKITPLECGLKSFVKMTKPSFIGKDALERRPPARKRIGLALVDKGIAREHCPVFDETGTLVGETTSGGPAPALGRNVAMALVTLEAAEKAELFIEVRGKQLKAEKVKLPFYKSQNQ